jgi:hypothetical protein
LGLLDEAKEDLHLAIKEDPKNPELINEFNAVNKKQKDIKLKEK